MKCCICENEMREPKEAHSREVSPIYADRCLACWKAGHELGMFLVRTSDRGLMGDWTVGWLREILKDPRRYE